MKFVDKISIAGLFHDIGKFYQRTGLELKDKNNYAYCPDEGRSHIHSAYTAQFFDNFEKEFSIFNNIDENDNENILNISAYHHKPSSPYELIIAEADRLASGFDRESFQHYNDLSKEEHKQQESYNKARLLSPFSRLYLGKSPNDLKLNEVFYEIDELVPENIFPKHLKDLNLNDKGDLKPSDKYLKLWNKFEADFKKIDFASALETFNNFYQSLLYVLERYTSFIPSSSYNTIADISLLDHSKVTSAIAASLYLFQKKSDSFNHSDIENREEKKYLIVQGDFSGIQRFVFDRYGESNKFAAKILRAKSLFVSAFTELTASYICDKAGANNTCILINAGGKFIIILPNKQEVIDIIENVKNGVNNNFLYDATYSQTVFNIAHIPFCGGDFKMGVFSSKMKHLAESLELKKLKPEIGKEKYVFSLYLDDISKADGVCEICGIRPIETVKNLGSDKIGLCRFDEIAIENGEELVKSDFIILKTEAFKKSIESNNQTMPGNSRAKYDFIDFADINGSKLNKKLNSGDIVYDVRGIYDKEEKPFEFSGYAKKPYKAYVPVFKGDEYNNIKYDDISEENKKADIKQGSIKLFNYIARDGRKTTKEEGKEKSIGVSHLAALKGDIDNAGQIFINGFKKMLESDKEDIYTISRLSMLSRMFDYFFGVWLPYKFLSDEFEFNSIYTVFAGGDDLFLIGPWNQIIRLSALISDKINELGGYNKEVHISIGISLASPSVPVYQLADKAEEELEKAKKMAGKNAVTVFGKTVKWDEFYKAFKLEAYFGDLLEEENESVSIGYIYKILKFIKMNDKIISCKANSGINLNTLYENAKWRALFRYITHRNYGKNKPLMEKLNSIPEYIEKFGDKLIIPISYAIYERRD
ncbi:MAG: type III-A CRISPR-associated protein Cas10/Csm1 [bacterium]